MPEFLDVLVGTREVLSGFLVVGMVRLGVPSSGVSPQSLLQMARKPSQVRDPTALGGPLSALLELLLWIKGI